MNRPVTLEDIARELGISKMTVSKALRGMRHVAPATRRAVEEAAARLGYRANPMVSSLMQQVRARRLNEEAGVIGYIARNRTVLREHDGKANLDGATTRAAELGYRLDVFPLTDYPDAVRLARVLQARAIQGAVFGPMDSMEPMHGFPWDCFCCVAAGLGHAHPPVSLVRRNVSQGIRLTGRKLEEAGFKRIAVLFTHQGNSELDLIAEGAIHMLVRHNSGDLSLIHPMDSPATIRKWLLSCRPDVILLHYPPHLELLQQAGYHPDGAVPIITLKTRGPRDPLAGIDHRPGEIGRVAVDFLNQDLQLNRTGLPASPLTIMIDCTWVETPGYRALLARR